VVRFHSALAERLGMNVTDFKCVAVLSESGAMTAGKLAERVGLSTAATTLVVDRLERAGLVRRERDPDDRRKVILRPVPNPALERDISAAMDGLARSMGEVLSAHCAVHTAAAWRRVPSPRARFKNGPEAAEHVTCPLRLRRR
jgi:DNA-binding MarR family transcriptional regulator